MKYHPFVILQSANILFSNFSLYAFRGTDALQPNSHMVHTHLARGQTTKWVLERREIRLINDVIVVFFLAMLKVFLSQETYFLAAKGPYPLMHIKNERSTCNHHANGKITESQIFIYNKGKDIPLTYLLDQHCACIGINIISSLARVTTKVLITFHQHIYCCFQFFFLPYYSPTRVFPR